MRLLNAQTRRLEEFGPGKVPSYAILSHTWGLEEVLYEDIRGRNPPTKAGYEKIERCCRQAIIDGLNFIWIDSFCIDKSSSAELSEAVNSMFRWYREARFCYVYLSDVSSDRGLSETSPFSSSPWFTRGWT